MPGDSPQFLPPCSEGPSDPLHPKDTLTTPESLVHDCYDRASLKNEIPPMPDLRSSGEQYLGSISSLLIPHEYSQAVKDQALNATLEKREAATEGVQKEAWLDILKAKDAHGKGLFPPGAQATDAFLLLMRGYNLTTREPSGKLTAEQLRYVNNYGLSHSADDSIIRSSGFEHIYKPQQN